MDRLLADRSRIGRAEVNEDSQPTNQVVITEKSCDRRGARWGDRHCLPARSSRWPPRKLRRLLL